MSQVVDGNATLRLSLVTDEAPHGAHDASEHRVTGPRPVVPSRAARLLRRVPLETAAVALTALVATAAVRGTDPLLLVALVVATVVQVFRAVRPAGASLTTAFTSTAQAVVLPAGLLALGLHVVDASRRVVDDALLLGVLAAVPAGLVATVVSRRSRPPRVVVVGDLPQVRGMVARWMNDRSVHVVGGLVVGPRAESAEPGLRDLDISSVGSIVDVIDHVVTHHADLVVVAPGPAVSADDVRRLSWVLESTHARLALIGAAEHVAPHRIDLDVIAGSTMAVLSPSRASAPLAVTKAVLDRAIGAVLALVVLPLVAVLSLLVRLDSRGPGFFTQVRVGRDGRLFTVYKLRTMSVDAEDHKAELQSLDRGNGVLFKIPDDPRITRLGRLLRRTSLDELPQLLNVLKGDMSLVGPRPALPEEVARYSDLERRRLAVKPGITGLWQVSGRSSLSREQSMQLDTSYVDNWRTRGDAAILLRTLSAVVSRRGAY